MNIWHDISPKVITKEKFTAVIEIPKGSKVKYELDKTTGLLRMDRILYTILQTMVLFLGRMQRTATRWTYWCFARKRLRLCLWLTVIL